MTPEPEYQACFCEYDDRVRQFQQWDPERHQRIYAVPLWLKELRRITGHNLDIVLNTSTWVFSLIHWVYSPSEVSVPVFVELVGFQGSPSQQWPAGLNGKHVLMLRMRPAAEQIKESRRLRAEQHYRNKEIKAEKLALRYEACRQLRKMGMDQEAWMIESGYKPFDPQTTLEAEAESILGR